jgi:hypothetical protein
VTNSTPAESHPGASAAPALRVDKGNPTPEELAALVVVLSAALGGEEAEPARARSPWSDPRWRLVGPSVRRNGWRTSALPH